MKKTFLQSIGRYGLVLGLAVTAVSCKKELPAAEPDATPAALVAVHNFALLMPTNAAVFINDAQLNLIGAPVALPLGGSLASNYVGVRPGSVKVAVRTTTGTADLASRTLPLANLSATSFFAFDTLTTGGTVRLLALTNDTKPAPAGTTNFRFLHFSPNAGPVTLSLTRTADPTGTAATGSTVFANVNYVGATGTPNETLLSAYTNIPAGTYTLALLSGSTPVFTSTLILREGKNYSWMARGFAPGRPVIPTGQTLGGSLILHNP